jgi:hypothetical protein
MADTHPMRGVQIIYVFEHIESGSFKIGFTSAFPGWRLMGVAGRDAPLKHQMFGLWRIVALMPGTAQDERNLHKAFSAHKLQRGNEWFKPCEAIRSFVVSVPYEGDAGRTLKSWLGYASDGGHWHKLSPQQRQAANALWVRACFIDRDHPTTAFIRNHYARMAALPQHKRHNASRAAIAICHA